MKMILEQLIAATESMNPVQFEAYCETNKIFIEWGDVTLSDFNVNGVLFKGFYNVTLPDYDDVDVFASNGSVIEFNV